MTAALAATYLFALSTSLLSLHVRRRFPAPDCHLSPEIKNNFLAWE